MNGGDFDFCTTNEMDDGLSLSNKGPEGPMDEMRCADGHSPNVLGNDVTNTIFAWESMDTTTKCVLGLQIYLVL